MKAISISNHDDIATSKVYEGIANYFLFDTKCKTVGGSGEHFDWSVLNAYDGSTPFLLSGGIGSDDVERVRNFCHPECIGIDLNSRFEISPALKDINKLKQFIQQL
jgi:phosphoribosylanthranilate isomerase